MAYVEDIFFFPSSIEHEVKWKGRYGAKGEQRAQKKEATPERILKQNQWKKEVNARRVMKLNFHKGDYWCTLLYKKGTRKNMNEVKEDMRKFMDKLRRSYKKRSIPLRFMYRIEIGARGGIHIHMICNKLSGEPPADVLVQDAWTEGRVNFVRFGGKEEDYVNLSSYLVKPQNEEQMNKRTPEERRTLRAYSSSRNLVRPEAVRKKYARRTVKKLLEEIIPKQGYVIDRDSVRKGVNPFTGLSYLYYTEVRCDSGGS